MATRTGRWRSAGDERMSLGDHLLELRKRLVISAIAIVVGAVAGFFLAPFVIDALRVPIEHIAEVRDAKIVYTNVVGAFDLRFSIAVTIAVLIASPIWLYQIFAFLVPGLTSKEKKYTFGFFFSAVPLFLAGAASGWFLFPHMVRLLTSFSSERRRHLPRRAHVLRLRDQARARDRNRLRAAGVPRAAQLRGRALREVDHQGLAGRDPASSACSRRSPRPRPT